MDISKIELPAQSRGFLREALSHIADTTLSDDTIKARIDSALDRYLTKLQNKATAGEPLGDEPSGLETAKAIALEVLRVSRPFGD